MNDDGARPPADSPPTSTAIVRAANLCKRFDSLRPALDSISLKIRAGELTAIVGADGAGKTTLLRMIAGLLRPNSGTLHVLDLDVARTPQTVQSRINYMPQHFGLYEDLSVQENLDLYADLHGLPLARSRERQTHLLRMTDLNRFRARSAGHLSGGMKQKLALACTLLRSPDLLLLDEPTDGVDPLSRRELWEIIQQLVVSESLSVILSTTYLEEAARCAQVFVLHEGRLLAGGSPQDLLAPTYGLTYTATPPQSHASAARHLQARLIDAPALITDAVPAGGAVRFIRHPASAASETIADRAALTALLGDSTAQPRPADFEDAFMLLLRQQQQMQPEDHALEISLSREPSTPSEALLREAPPDALAAPPAIVVRDLVRRFGDFTAVAHTSFTVARGEIFGLLGPNGAGKTTTFRMLCGLLPASSGTLEVAGVNLRHARRQARANIGYVSQKFALYGNLSVRENLAFFGAAYGLRGARLRRRIAAIEAQFGLVPEALSGSLPAGYKQRLAMATALLHEPQILFLDEPTSGIDPLARRAFWRTITALAQGGTTIIITTHFMEESEYCDRIAIQEAGNLLALGTPNEVRTRAGPHIRTMNDAFIAIIEQARQGTTDLATPSSKP